jgi:hypothetical protein
MKVRRLLAALLSTPVFVSAVDVAYSPPVGGMIQTIQGSSNGVPKVTVFSPTLRMPVGDSFTGKVKGVVTSLTGNTLTVAEAGWTPSALSAGATPYFVIFRSGQAEGTCWQVATTTGNTSFALTLLARGGVTAVSSGAAAGDRFELVPGDTLDSLLGSISAESGDTSAELADAVRLHDGVTWKEYYFNTTAGQWREGASSFNRSNVVIRADSGIVYVRKKAGNASIVLTGNVSTQREKALVGATGVVLVSSVFPVSRTLADLAPQTLVGFVANTGTLADADKITIHDGTTWKSYNYHVASGRWREGSSTFDKGSTVLPAGSAFMIERGAGANSSAFLSITPPFSL